jgi:hypothetical protein
MPDSFVTEFNEISETQSGGHPHDLLARLYREIGISAVAAALDAIAKPLETAAPVEQFRERGVPAVLMSEDLAA